MAAICRAICVNCSPRSDDTALSCDKCSKAHVHGVPNERAALFDNAFGHRCGCENCKVSEFSPGPVQDNETLHLIITDPQSILGDGRFHPQAFMRVDSSGLSVLREMAKDDEFILTMTELSARKECYFHGVLQFKASDVRYCYYDRFLCVYDTALKEKPHHADMMAAPIAPSDGSWTKSKADKARMEFAKEVRLAVGKAMIEAKEFRGGLLVKFARP